MKTYLKLIMCAVLMFSFIGVMPSMVGVAFGAPGDEIVAAMELEVPADGTLVETLQPAYMLPSGDKIKLVGFDRLTGKYVLRHTDPLGLEKEVPIPSGKEGGKIIERGMPGYISGYWAYIKMMIVEKRRERVFMRLVPYGVWGYNTQLAYPIKPGIGVREPIIYPIMRDMAEAIIIVVREKDAIACPIEEGGRSLTVGAIDMDLGQVAVTTDTGRLYTLKVGESEYIEEMGRYFRSRRCIRHVLEDIRNVYLEVGKRGGREVELPPEQAALRMPAFVQEFLLGLAVPPDKEKRVRRIYEGAFQLTAKVYGEDGVEMLGHPVRWETTNPAVATVDQYGNVTPIRIGRVGITAAAGEIEEEVSYTTSWDIVPPFEDIATIPDAIKDDLYYLNDLKDEGLRITGVDLVLKTVSYRIEDLFTNLPLDEKIGVSIGQRNFFHTPKGLDVYFELKDVAPWTHPKTNLTQPAANFEGYPPTIGRKQMPGRVDIVADTLIKVGALNVAPLKTLLYDTKGYYIKDAAPEELIYTSKEPLKVEVVRDALGNYGLKAIKLGFADIEVKHVPTEFLAAQRVTVRK